MNGLTKLVLVLFGLVLSLILGAGGLVILGASLVLLEALK